MNSDITFSESEFELPFSQQCSQLGALYEKCIAERNKEEKKSLISGIEFFGRTFSIIWGTGVSPTRPIYAGVPQGSVLGPLLFNLFTHDMPRDFGRHVEIDLYADDLTMFASSIYKEQAVRYLQRAVDEMESYYKKWKINLNQEKTKALLFQLLHLEIDDHVIPWSLEATYLGLRLDAGLTWEHHTTYPNYPKEETDGVQVLHQAYSSRRRTPVELGCHIKNEDHRSRAEQSAAELPTPAAPPSEQRAKRRSRTL
ncbi:hypothetical protein J437_LFUL017032 [Ladona fulva]|uniref:Reverse transcriptase domain-containing protein n=1 Tax=Ladona fulva TaxID=123851 RepID=A0A8K0P8W7_LADFU|nr:hypothetical protein J437_LFUL017032 [Ladona fulva]